ncbi:hypothetical protein [Stackebrandtia nassauensis]|uniref:Uncharacterized protein n=1 Tax=Stackebrandtia nassauensis (strain DSM 44728 / CIP 108903 / NRRL B-16338 / NBRC 102104 / LLR-40K-21) TaxID=446470 RepID=D3Q2D5_STANL|nr:hypothetical protein [Stackebrandtia nassauensis]ADD43868.1 hypothetical protein Snas_4219 [Stackebrandtia nassauensis DSM 44728]
MGVTIPAIVFVGLLTLIVLCAMRGTTPSERVEILKAAASLAREWRHPILSLRRLPNVSTNGQAPVVDNGLPQITDGVNDKSSI